MNELQKSLEKYNNLYNKLLLNYNEITLEVHNDSYLDLLSSLKKDPNLKFEQLIDLCGVDYLGYGVGEWQTISSTSTGYSRSRRRLEFLQDNYDNRFAVVLHLLSLEKNFRVRVKLLLQKSDNMLVHSICDLYPNANWYERECYDLFGVLFANHPDLRRILTDYEFIGHPFRKDFPLIGEVEISYNGAEERVLYDEVEIESRTLVPKVVRKTSIMDEEQEIDS